MWYDTLFNIYACIYATDIDLPQGSIMDYGPQSICVAKKNTNVANCVAHRCVQIQGTELMAFSLTINGIVIKQLL